MIIIIITINSYYYYYIKKNNNDAPCEAPQHAQTKQNRTKLKNPFIFSPQKKTCGSGMQGGPLYYLGLKVIGIDNLYCLNNPKP